LICHLNKRRHRLRWLQVLQLLQLPLAGKGFGGLLCLRDAASVRASIAAAFFLGAFPEATLRGLRKAWRFGDDGGSGSGSGSGSVLLRGACSRLGR
jgi:hypothetical protein